MTCDPKLWGSPLDAYTAMRKALKILFKRISRFVNDEDIAYFVMTEELPCGYPHFHIAFRGPFLKQAWLKAQWEQLTGAIITNIRYIKTAHDVAAYVSKYLTKSPARFGNSRRFSFSKNWVVEKQTNNKKTKGASIGVLEGLTPISYFKIAQADGWQGKISKFGQMYLTHPIPNKKPPLWDCTKPIQSIWDKQWKEKTSANHWRSLGELAVEVAMATASSLALEPRLAIGHSP